MNSGTDELFYLKSDGSLSGGDYCRTEIIAKLFGVSVRRIQQLTQEGVLPTTQTKDGRRYDLIPTIQNYVKYLSEKARSKSSGKSEREVQLREQKLEAEIALKESQGELHRLRTEIASGKYISIEEATLDYTRFFTVFKRFAMLNMVRQLQWDTGVEQHIVSLTNSDKYPFNNSAVTVALDERRNNLDYSVEAEVLSRVGPVSDVTVFDRQLNGFKVKFEGSGSAATVRLKVVGGYT